MLFLASLGIAMVGQNSVAARVPTPLKMGALAYFSAKCARCHGPEGTYYPDGFAAKKTDAQLRKILDDMGRGAGKAPISGIDLEAQLAFHRAIDGQLPFLTWTQITNSVLTGETNTEHVEARSGTRTILITVKDEAWTLRLPAGIKPSAVEIIARTDKGLARLKLRDAPFSKPGNTQKPHSTL